MVNQILEFNLPVSIFKEEDKFVAYTPALDLSTSADTFEKVKKRFTEIVNIFFEELKEKGTLNQVLEELGWQMVKQNWFPPVLVAQESERIQVAI